MSSWTPEERKRVLKVRKIKYLVDPLPLSLLAEINRLGHKNMDGHKKTTGQCTFPDVSPYETDRLLI